MSEAKALLVFCEGAHDVAFVGKVFKLGLDFQKIEWKFSEYPAPFNALFKTSVQNHAAKDLSLDMAHKFFLPDCVFQKGDNLILVFNAGGSSQVDKVKKLLKSFLTLLSHSTVFPDNSKIIVTQAKYLFLYDADHIGTTTLFNKIKQDFLTIDDEPTWAFGNWSFLENPFGAIAEDKAAYIWGTNTENGTLEDILLPMFELDQKKLVENARNFVGDAFVWETDATRLKHKFAEIAARKKAIITCAGQREKTGSSMNVVIGQAKLISDPTFLTNSNVQSFVAFIKNFLDITIT